MNTANNDPRTQWQRDGGQRYDQHSYTNGTQQGDRFFSWIRESRLVRSQERWVGGVCGGIAEYLGWNPTLVRAIMLASVLVYGFGAAFYAIAWFFLPDGPNGVIMAQQLLNGLWDWVMLAPLFCLAVAIIMPGFGLAVTAVSGLAFLLLVNKRVHYWRRTDPYTSEAWSSRTDTGYAPSSGPMRTPQSQAGPTPQQPMPSYDSVQPVGPEQSSASSQARGSDESFADEPATGPQPYSAPQMPGTQQTFATPQPYIADGAARSQILRRKPAGFAVVLIVTATISLCIAWVLLSNQGVNAYLEPLLRSAIFATAGICLGIGLVILVLGLIGRRAGGLIPLAWITAIAAVCVLVGGVQYASVFADMNRTNAAYTKVVVQGYRTFGSDDRQMAQLQRGMAFQGISPQNGNAVNIDLSQYAELHGKHELSIGLSDKITKVQSGCPTGIINLTAYKTQVFITLPDGCSYGFGENRLEADTSRSSLGGPYSIVNIGQGFSHTYLGLEDPNTNSETPGIHGDNYRWRDGADTMPTNGPELVINSSHVMDATVTVQYQSESHMPSYKTTTDKESR